MSIGNHSSYSVTSGAQDQFSYGSHDSHGGRRTRGPRDQEQSDQTIRRPTRETAKSVTTDTQGTLSVVTKDGDKVTLSFSAQKQYQAASYKGSEGYARVRSSSSSTTVGVKVEGNLSDEELKDLTTLLGALGKAAGESNKGETPDVGGLVKSLQRLETLAKFDFQESQNVQVGSLIRLAA